MRGPQLKQTGSVYGDGVPGQVDGTNQKFILDVNPNLYITIPDDDTLSANGTWPALAYFKNPGGELTLVGDAIRMVGGGAWNTYGLASQHEYTRVPGLAVYFKVDTNQSGITNIGTHNSKQVTCSRSAWQLSDANLAAVSAGSRISSEIAVASGIYELVVVLRTTGAYWFVCGGDYGNDWTLFWVGGTDTTDAYLSCGTHSITLDLFRARLAMLPDAVANEVLTDYDSDEDGTDEFVDSTPIGNGYDVFAARDLDIVAQDSDPAASDTGTHTADCVVEFVCGAPSGDTELFVRYIDATHYDSIKIDASGDLTYNVANGGAAAAIITAAGVISGGERISAALNGDNVSLYYDGTLAGSSAGATANAAGTTWEMGSEADDVTALVFRTLDGVGNQGSPNHPGLGLATAILPGPLQANDTYTHPTCFMMRFKSDVMASAGRAELSFRRQDTENRFFIQVDSGGGFLLRNRVGGAWNTLASVYGMVGTEEYTVVVEGDTVRGYYDDTLAWTYGGATQFQDQTAGLVTAIGTDQQLKNLVIRPLYPTGQVRAALTALADY